MCEVCKSAEKCEHPWSQCLASRGEHCATCGHGSRSAAPLRTTDAAQQRQRLESEGQPRECVSSPSGEGRACRLTPG